MRATDFLPLLGSLNMTRMPAREYWHVHIDHVASDFYLSRKSGMEPVLVSGYVI